MHDFSIKVEKSDIERTVIIKPEGSIDSTTSNAWEKQLNGSISIGCKYIVIDFSKVTFVSSMGVGALLSAAFSLREKNGDLFLMNVSDRVQEIFDILNIHDYFITIESISRLKDFMTVR